MERSQDLSTRRRNSNEDVDLNYLFSKTGEMLRILLTWVHKLFDKVAAVVIIFSLFLLKHFLWLVTGILVGVALSFLFKETSGARYSYSMTFRGNFNANQNIYTSVNLINALIKSGKQSEIGPRFNLSDSDAVKLISCEVMPANNELLIIELYKDQLFGPRWRQDWGKDSILATRTDYHTFKSSLSSTDYPLQKIIVSSSQPVSIKNFQNGLIGYASSGVLIKQLNESAKQTNNEDVVLLDSLLSNLDVLINRQNKLWYDQPARTSRYNTALNDGQIRLQPKEIDLYEKMLILKEEKSRTMSRIIFENEIINIYSSMELSDYTPESTSRSTLRYALIGLLSALGIISIIKFYAFLRNYEKKRVISVNTKQHAI